MLRLALIGCPDVTAVYPRIASRIRGGRFVAVTDPDVRAARCTAVALEADISCDSLDTLLSEHSAAFDAVVIHCPGRFRFPLCQRAAAAGKHILVESPMADSAASAAAIIDACRSVQLMVAQAFRFLPALQVVKASLDKGSLGEPGLLRIHRWEPPGCEVMSPAPTREIDLACWLFGRQPTLIYATGRPDYTQLHLGFAEGMALIDHARTLPPGDGYFSLSLIGSTGAAYADDHHNTHLLFGRGHPAALVADQGEGHMLAQIEEFIRAVETRATPPITGADDRRALQVAEAACVSMEKGQSLSWNGHEYTLVG